MFDKLACPDKHRAGDNARRARCYYDLSCQYFKGRQQFLPSNSSGPTKALSNSDPAGIMRYVHGLLEQCDIGFVEPERIPLAEHQATLAGHSFREGTWSDANCAQPRPPGLRRHVDRRRPVVDLAASVKMVRGEGRPGKRLRRELERMSRIGRGC